MDKNSFLLPFFLNKYLVSVLHAPLERKHTGYVTESCVEIFFKIRPLMETDCKLPRILRTFKKKLCMHEKAVKQIIIA